MSDHYDFWFFPTVPKNEAGAVKARVLGALWENQIVEMEQDPQTTLGEGDSYAPTEGLANAYSDPNANGSSSWTKLLTRGLEVIEGFGFQGMEINLIETVTCPGCGEIPIEELTEAILKAAAQFHDTGIIPEITCQCGSKVHATELRSTPELTFTYVGFNFWNWPPLDAKQTPLSSGWQTDIPKMMADAAGYPIRHSWGRI